MERQQLHHIARWLAAALVAGVVAAACGGISSSSRTPAAPAATASSPSGTATAVHTLAPTAVPDEGRATEETPVPAATPASPPRSGTVTGIYTPPPSLTASDLVARGQGEPGRGAFNIERVIIPHADVDAPAAAALVGTDGRMPNPPNKDTVAWYDFSAWPGLGGLPGVGGNVVLAGDSGRFGEGLGVFWRMGRVTVGDYVKLVLTGARTLCYRVEWKGVVGTSEADFTSITQATASEYVTLISAGSTTEERTITSAARASCGAEPTLTPTPAPPAGHQRLKITAQGLKFTVVEGGTVPPGIHTVDYALQVLDSGIQHTIAFYDTAGRELIASEPFEGPTTASGAFGVGPPQPPGTYTFRCSIHPEMTGRILVRS
jgi:plastocyanin